MTEAIDLLIRGAFLLPMTPGAGVVRDGEVAIRAGRIVHAGPARAAGTWAPARLLGGPDAALLPGFVDCHTHVASTVFRGRTDDASKGTGLYDVAFRMEKTIAREEWRDLAWLGCVEMIRAGITTVNDIWYAPDLLAEAVEGTGLRAQIANKVFDVALENLAAGDYRRYPEVGERRMREGVEFVERWHGRAGGRITARIGPHASDTCAPELHRDLRREADRLGVGTHLHTAQSKREADHIRAVRGCGVLEYLRDIGVLRADTVCAHLSFATDHDLEAMRETGARYAHCPPIYPRRGRYPRLLEIMARGIPTGFATDWMQNDPLEGMRIAMNAVRVLAGDADVLPSAQALQLSTAGAAGVLGLEREIGTLEAGKKADVIVIDLDRPHLQPFYGDTAALVFYARADDVVASVIDGRVVMAERRLEGVDEDRLRARVRARIPVWSERLAALARG